MGNELPPMVDPSQLDLDGFLEPTTTELLWPPGGLELAYAAVVALGLIVLLLSIHVVGAWGRRR